MVWALEVWALCVLLRPPHLLVTRAAPCWQEVSFPGVLGEAWVGCRAAAAQPLLRALSCPAVSRVAFPVVCVGGVSHGALKPSVAFAVQMAWVSGSFLVPQPSCHSSVSEVLVGVGVWGGEWG